MLDEGITPPPIRQGVRVPRGTRRGEPAAYSGLALDFVARLVEAHREGLEYLLIYEDDAFPCADAPLSDILRRDEIPPAPSSFANLDRSSGGMKRTSSFGTDTP